MLCQLCILSVGCKLPVNSPAVILGVGGGFFPREELIVQGIPQKILLPSENSLRCHWSTLRRQYYATLSCLPIVT